MGRHAASEESTVSPPRSNTRTLRDLTGDLPNQPEARPHPADAIPVRISPSSAAPDNRGAVHTNRGAVHTDRGAGQTNSGAGHTNSGAGHSRVADGRGIERAAVNPDSAISAAELIARFRESGLLSNTARTRRPQPAPAPAAIQRVKEPTGPLRVADLRARQALLLSGEPAGEPTGKPAQKPTGHRAGSARRPSGVDRGPVGAQLRSARAVLPALRAEPSIRVAVRPVLTVAAIIAAVGLIEAPTLLASHSTADARQAATSATSATTTVAGPDAARTAAIRAADNFPVAAPVTTSAPERVSRSTRRALGAPAKAAAANHVPLMKPGQTVPGTWIRPSTGRYTSCFCARWGSFHAGIDLASPLGTPIVAVGDGTVIKAGPASGFGNWVVIQHANGDVSIYGHMKYFFVHVGQKVTAGEKIAVVGDQGFSTGPHLHFEIHKGGFTGPKIDPIPWLKARGIVIGPRSSDG